MAQYDISTKYLLLKYLKQNGSGLFSFKVFVRFIRSVASWGKHPIKNTRSYRGSAKTEYLKFREINEVERLEQLFPTAVEVQSLEAFAQMLQE